MLNPLNLRELDTGTGNSIELRHISQDTPGPTTVPKPGTFTVRRLHRAAPHRRSRLLPANRAAGRSSSGGGDQHAAAGGPGSR